MTGIQVLIQGNQATHVGKLLGESGQLLWNFFLFLIYSPSTRLIFQIDSFRFDSICFDSIWFVSICFDLIRFFSICFDSICFDLIRFVFILSDLIRFVSICFDSIRFDLFRFDLETMPFRKAWLYQEAFFWFKFELKAIFIALISHFIDELAMPKKYVVGLDKLKAKSKKR